MDLLTTLASQTASSECFSKTMRWQPLSELLNTPVAVLLCGHLSQLHAFSVSHSVPCQVWTSRILILVLCPGLPCRWLIHIDNLLWALFSQGSGYLHFFPSFAVGQILAPHLVPSGLPRLKKKLQPTVKIREEQVEIFPSWDPEDENWGRQTLHLLVWGRKEILRMMHITHHLISFPGLKYLAHCSFRAKLWDSGTLSEPSRTIWDKMYKIWDDHKNEPD